MYSMNYYGINHCMTTADCNLQVRDLEVELETTKEKSKENLQQAILIERERFTQMQWDMEELRRKSLEMEMKLKSELVFAFALWILNPLFFVTLQSFKHKS